MVSDEATQLEIERQLSIVEDIDMAEFLESPQES